MDMQPQFSPDRRRDDHKRNSEAGVYDQLAHSGQALHEPKALPEAPELDFCVWLEGLGLFRPRGQGRPVLRGQDRLNHPDRNGPEHVPCPLTQTWDAAIAVRDAVHRVLGFKVFIIPVLLFTDTPRGPLIEEWAGQHRVKVLFGADDLVERLVERLLALAYSMGAKHRPTTDDILKEVDAVSGGLLAPARDGDGYEAVQKFIARQAPEP